MDSAWLITNVVLVATLCGCASTASQTEATRATFQILSRNALPSSENNIIQLTQKELRDAVVRLGTSYINALSDQFFRLVRDADSAVIRADAQAQLSAISTSVLQIIIGPSPEDNLLDMLVLTKLLRITFEDHWVPKVYGAKGLPLLQKMRIQEKALWSLSEKFLTSEQRNRLKWLITEWRQANPDQADVEGVRLVDFASDDTLQSLHPPGLLPEIQDMTRSIDETRILAERFSVLLQFLPRVSLLHTRATLYEFLAEPEPQQFLSDVTDFTTTADSIAKTADTLPERLGAVQSTLINEFADRLRREREAAIHQIREEFSHERQETIEHLLAQIENSTTELRGILHESRETLVSGKELALSATDALMAFDAIAVKLGWDQVDSSGEPFNIVAYRDTAYGLRDAAREFDTTLRSLNLLLNASGSQDASNNLVTLMDKIDRLVQHWLILVFVLSVTSILVIRGVTAAVVMFYRRRSDELG